MNSYGSNLNTLIADKLLICSTPAYRRLANKTQVFHNAHGSEGHLHRTRLTHSNEVAALSAYVAMRLGLNHELAEILGLSHDIGHSCFGHVGQDALASVLQKYSNGKETFEHNSQAIRILSALDSTTKNKINPLILKGLQKRAEHGLKTPSNFGESQVMDICDMICYLSSDVQDALNVGIISLSQLFELPYFSAIFAEYATQHNIDNVDDYLKDEGYNNIMNFIRNLLTEDLISTSKQEIIAMQIMHSDDFMSCGRKLIVLSSTMWDFVQEIKKFMFDNVYHSTTLKNERADFATIVTNLFNYFTMDNNYQKLGSGAIQRYENGEAIKGRVIADYISGCDDKYAINLHKMYCPELHQSLLTYGEV